MPEGKDPCDFILAAGKERFEQIIDEAVDVFQFKWERLKDKFNGDDTLAGRKGAVEEYMQTIATGLQAGNVPALDCGLRVNQISRIIGLDSRQINAELNKRVGRAQRSAGYQQGEQEVAGIDYGRGAFAAAQREVLEVLLNEPGLYETLRQEITAEVFDVPILRQIAAILFEMLSIDSETPLRQVLAGTESVELAKCLMELAHAGQEKGNFESRLTGALEAIERHQAQKHKSGIETVADQSEYLRRLYDNTDKTNVRNVGMI